ncbi:MAG: formylglycine-generating enzyme family protein [Planctomycetes bacterium]|nr:formylglycine-generating enzyme family protein [Planctomycetota bacterium]
MLRLYRFSIICFYYPFVFAVLGYPALAVDTFGTGANTFEIEFVTIGDQDNAADFSGVPQPAGSVAYEYLIGKYEISEQVIQKANAQSLLDGDLLEISVSNRGPDKPATSITWFEAARFVNWLNEEQGFAPAYKFNEIPGARPGSSPTYEFAVWEPSDPGYNANNLFRNRRANYVLPTVDEWYKAAYYDAENGQYFDFATGENSAPQITAGGMDAGTAVYQLLPDAGPANVTLAGGLSPYGVSGLNGNVSEWNETADDAINDITGERRVLRGGAWASSGASLSATIISGDLPDLAIGNTGFRVVSLGIPEPASISLVRLYRRGGPAHTTHQA